MKQIDKQVLAIAAGVLLFLVCTCTTEPYNNKSEQYETKIVMAGDSIHSQPIEIAEKSLTTDTEDENSELDCPEDASDFCSINSEDWQ